MGPCRNGIVGVGIAVVLTVEVNMRAAVLWSVVAVVMGMTVGGCHLRLWDECEEDVDCDGGEVCASYTEVTESRFCLPPAERGERCGGFDGDGTLAVACALDLLCERDPDADVGEKICVPSINPDAGEGEGEGEAGGEGGSIECDADADCADGEVCASYVEAYVNRFCRLPAALGESCGGDFDGDGTLSVACAGDLLCAPDPDPDAVGNEICVASINP